MPGPRSATMSSSVSASTRAPNLHRRAGRRVERGVGQKIGQGLLHQNKIHPDERQAGGHLDGDLMPRQFAPGFLDRDMHEVADLAQKSRLGFTLPDSRRVMSRTLPTSRFRRPVAS